jgi:hypothetical protein
MARPKCMQHRLGAPRARAPQPHHAHGSYSSAATRYTRVKHPRREVPPLAGAREVAQAWLPALATAASPPPSAALLRPPSPAQRSSSSSSDASGATRAIRGASGAASNPPCKQPGHMPMAAALRCPPPSACQQQGSSRCIEMLPCARHCLAYCTQSRPSARKSADDVSSTAELG